MPVSTNDSYQQRFGKSGATASSSKSSSKRGSKKKSSRNRTSNNEGETRDESNKQQPPELNANEAMANNECASYNTGSIPHVSSIDPRGEGGGAAGVFSFPLMGKRMPPREHFKQNQEIMKNVNMANSLKDESSDISKFSNFFFLHLEKHSSLIRF